MGIYEDLTSALSVVDYSSDNACPNHFVLAIVPENMYNQSLAERVINRFKNPII